MMVETKLAVLCLTLTNLFVHSEKKDASIISLPIIKQVNHPTRPRVVISTKIHNNVQKGLGG